MVMGGKTEAMLKSMGVPIFVLPSNQAEAGEMI